MSEFHFQNPPENGGTLTAALLVRTIRAHWIAVKRHAMTPGKDLPGAACGINRGLSGFASKPPHTNLPRFAIPTPRPSRQPGRQGDRHGQGSDAQQQGKEEAKGRQEPQKGRRRAGQSVRGGKNPGRPKPEQQEELRFRSESVSLNQTRRLCLMAAPAKPGALKPYGATPQLHAQLASSRPRRLFASWSTTLTCVS